MMTRELYGCERKLSDMTLGAQLTFESIVKNNQTNYKDNQIMNNVDSYVCNRPMVEKTSNIKSVFKTNVTNDKQYSGETTDEYIREVKTMSVFPTEQDLFGGAPLLEKNVVEGAYRNVDHYLSVQFRLLREDFVAPLREGILDYLHNKLSQEEPEVFIFHDVHILGTTCLYGGQFGHKVKFSQSKDWPVISQQCIFGSLMIFTTDNFKSFFGGTVYEIDHATRIIIAKLDSRNYNIFKNISLTKSACRFTVAIPKAYFEAYFHVLKGLQHLHIHLDIEPFPMKKYIVEVSRGTPKPPAYIKDYGLEKYIIDGKYNVNILEPYWPIMEHMKLNKSQQEAFQAALTNEFVAIQGPPGTGKTFLAVKIVSALLDNVNVDTPILIVAFKNHALDQFLEGILEKTSDIIRIGGNSQSEKLECYNIKNHRPKYGFNKYATPMKNLAKVYEDLTEKSTSSNKYQSQNEIKQEMKEIYEQIQDLERDLNNARHNAEIKVMRKAKVVGMTTTAAARMRPWLNQLGAKIVVIEEAAEVLEAHIVTALSSQCQHVILIGDHKQLRPNPEVYELCTKYNLDVSLFERMVKNGLNCHQLNVQHRMRPEFSSLITPSIYETLHSDSFTRGRPNIRGVCENIYFINHNHNEMRVSMSYANEHEAEFVVQLAKYLTNQGHKPGEISILATYSAQVKLINRKMIDLLDVSGLKVSTVDDFQGQENKIIILSLVRSNQKRSVGFLKKENRVCVALSRARDGFYMIGNMDLLSSNTEIWPQVQRSLERLNAIGDSLGIITNCQYHLKYTTRVKNGNDISRILEQGCQMVCKAPLSCGHSCSYTCHLEDRDHTKEHKCRMKCKRKLCARGHPCMKSCGEKCPPCSSCAQQHISNIALSKCTPENIKSLKPSVEIHAVNSVIDNVPSERDTTSNVSQNPFFIPSREFNRSYYSRPPTENIVTNTITKTSSVTHLSNPDKPSSPVFPTTKRSKPCVKCTIL